MNNNLYKIKHIVVLMLENRAFDHMAGWLYSSENERHKMPLRGQTFEGVSGKNLSNPIPVDAQGNEKKIVKVGRGALETNPNPNSGEEYFHVNTQLFGTAHYPYDKPPYNLPENPPDVPLMNGFVRDYINVLKSVKHSARYKDYKIIMDCFTPEQLPVLSGLAYNYAVSDNWFCSVPTQTYANRSFVHSASSSGLVLNAPYITWAGNVQDTIYNRIQDEKNKNITWKVYYDKLDIFPLVYLTQPKLWPYRKTNFFTMQDFMKDAANGTLPSYSFIEPRFFIDNNDEHPQDTYQFGISNVLKGEILLYKIYEALINGKNWNETLFILTYDMHGGMFDHVPPPKAVPPYRNMKNTQCGFKFDRLGLRVCTLLISPYIEKGTVFHLSKPFDHTSILKTVEKRWNLKNLTLRDLNAADVSDVLTLNSPRDDHPFIKPRKVTTPHFIVDEPISNSQKSIVNLAASAVKMNTPKLETTKDAVEFLNLNKDRIENEMMKYWGLK